MIEGGGMVIRDEKHLNNLRARQPRIMELNLRPHHTLYSWFCKTRKCQQEHHERYTQAQSQTEYEQIRTAPESRYDKLGIPRKYYRATLDDFSGPRELADIAWRYVKSPRHSMLFSGDTGTGKTYMTVAIMREFVKAGKSNMRFVRIPDMLLDIRSSYDPDSPDNERAVIQKYTNVGFLVMDDFGTEKQSEYSITALYMIIDERLNAERPTLLTTNLTLDQIAEHHGSRIARRLDEYSTHRFTRVIRAGSQPEQVEAELTGITG